MRTWGRLLLAAALATGLGGTAGAQQTDKAAASPFTDTHAHWEQSRPRASVEAALAAMPRENAVRIVFMTPPLAGEDAGFEAEAILPFLRDHADKLSALGGGASLNPTILESAVSGKPPSAELRQQFRRRAEEMLVEGYSGFGEMAIEHFPAVTPYEHVAADYPLLLLLADIAAEHDVPLVVHMEAVTQEMAAPPEVKSSSKLEPNIPAFERLLAHNRGARIVWAHAGGDNTGERTPELCRRLLAENPNLYMDIKIDPRKPGKNSPLTGGASGPIKPEWLKLFQDFPDRFVIGSDQHYPQPKADVQRWQAVVGLLNQLPEDLRKKIGTENAARIYPAAGREP